MDTPQLRLMYFIQKKYHTQKAFADAFGVSLSYVNKYTKSDGSIFRDARLLNKLTNLGLNVDWYLTGDGEMEVLPTSLPNVNENRGVPYYPMDVTGSIVRSFDDIQEQPQFYVDFKPLNDCTAYFPVCGDSMCPQYCNGDVVAVKQINNHSLLSWGETYLVITDEEYDCLRTIKNIHPHQDKDKIVLRAVNPEYAGDMELKKEHIVNLFLVKGKLRLAHL